MPGAQLDTGLCFRDGGDFARSPLPGGGLAFFRAELACDGLAEALRRPEALFERAAKVLKDSKSSKAALSHIDGVGDVFVKRHNTKSVRYVLRHLFRPARAFRNWQNAWYLEQLAAPTPRPIAAVAFRRALVLRGSYIITERVEGLLPTAPFVVELHRSGGLDAFLASVFGHLAKMHEAGIRHGDLKFSNLAATRDASGGIAFAAFMDLDSMKRVKRPLDKTERGVELARLAASTVAIVADSGETLDRAALCARFAKLYADAGGGTLDPETLSAEIGIWLA